MGSATSSSSSTPSQHHLIASSSCSQRSQKQQCHLCKTNPFPRCHSKSMPMKGNLLCFQQRINNNKYSDLLQKVLLQKKKNKQYNSCCFRLPENSNLIQQRLQGRRMNKSHSLSSIGLVVENEDDEELSNPIESQRLDSGRFTRKRVQSLAEFNEICTCTFGGNTNCEGLVPEISPQVDQHREEEQQRSIFTSQQGDKHQVNWRKMSNTPNNSPPIISSIPSVHSAHKTTPTKQKKSSLQMPSSVGFAAPPVFPKNCSLFDGNFHGGVYPNPNEDQILLNAVEHARQKWSTSSGSRIRESEQERAENSDSGRSSLSNEESTISTPRQRRTTFADGPRQQKKKLSSCTNTSEDTLDSSHQLEHSGTHSSSGTIRKMAMSTTTKHFTTFDEDEVFLQDVINSNHLKKQQQQQSSHSHYYRKQQASKEDKASPVEKRRTRSIPSKKALKEHENVAKKNSDCGQLTTSSTAIPNSSSRSKNGKKSSTSWRRIMRTLSAGNVGSRTTGEGEKPCQPFGPGADLNREWEIVTVRELCRRLSLEDSFEPSEMPLPEGSQQSQVFDEFMIRQIVDILPPRAEGYPWVNIYSSEKHGFSLSTLYRKMSEWTEEMSPILLVVRDVNGRVFGAVSSTALRPNDHYYGTGDSCILFRFTGEFPHTRELRSYTWTGENQFFINATKEFLSMGAGGGKYGLWLDADLNHGRSQRCATFNNDPLAGGGANDEDFVVQFVEAFGFSMS